MNTKELIKIALRAAEEASKVILEVYDSNDFQAELKGDNSPLTLADKKAHRSIEQILKETQLPVLSEEGKDIPYEVRKHWEYFWLVDPLDGTKEFIKRNGEFTVNIALIHNQLPVVGVVAVPVTGEVYYAYAGGGAFQIRNGMAIKLNKREPVDLTTKGLRIVASRSHLNEETSAFVNSLNAPQLISKGSSLKFMLLAAGEADVYPRFAPTMEWDTAAAHAILIETGMNMISQPQGEPLVYNKKDLLNPSFLV